MLSMIQNTEGAVGDHTDATAGPVARPPHIELKGDSEKTLCLKQKMSSYLCPRDSDL